MGKRRTAAKTGDKKLYASRNVSVESRQQGTQSVDEFHQQRDESFMALESGETLKGPTDDVLFETKQNILDLGVNADSSDEDEESDDDEGGSSEMEDNTKSTSKNQGVPEYSENVEDESSEGDDEMEALDDVDPRSWGRKKSAYYSADTGDLEIGQDEDVSFLNANICHRMVLFVF